MSKRFIITESDRDQILKMYGLLTEQAETPVCSNGGCSGKYTGPEFDNTGDVAHKYSNTITQYVAAKLKELYRSGTYVKVDFKGIQMTTKGMGSGNVVYTVVIPFVGVSNKCDARTGFAHVGGWNHTPELNARKSEILNYIPSGKKENVVLNNELDVSQLTKTPEGLQEYWIQWKHRDYQSDCGGQTQQQNQGKQQSGSGPINIQAQTLDELEKNIKTQTTGKSLDLTSIKLDMENKTFSVNLGNTPVYDLRLRYNVPGESTCLACENTISKNTEYGAKELKGGRFENNTRIYSLIVLFSKKQ